MLDKPEVSTSKPFGMDPSETSRLPRRSLPVVKASDRWSSEPSKHATAALYVRPPESFLGFNDIFIGEAVVEVKIMVFFELEGPLLDGLSLNRCGCCRGLDRPSAFELTLHRSVGIFRYLRLMRKRRSQKNKCATRTIQITVTVTHLNVSACLNLNRTGSPIELGYRILR